MMPLIVFAGVLAAGTLAWLATVNAGGDHPVHPAPVAGGLALEQGRVYYAQLCMDCHGARGDGQGEWAYRVSPRPPSLRAARVRARSDSELDRFIRDGIPGSPMIGVTLSDSQRRQLAGYVRYLGEKRDGPAR